MAEPKRGSKEAFLAAEKRRKDRVKSKAKGFNIFNLSGVEKRRKENEAFNKKVRAKNEKARSENPSYAKFKASDLLFNVPILITTLHSSVSLLSSMYNLVSTFFMFLKGVLMVINQDQTFLPENDLF